MPATPHEGLSPYTVATTYNVRNGIKVEGLGSTPRIVPLEGPCTIHIPEDTQAWVYASCDTVALTVGGNAEWVPIITGQNGPYMGRIDLDFAALSLSANGVGTVFITKK